MFTELTHCMFHFSKTISMDKKSLQSIATITATKEEAYIAPSVLKLSAVVIPTKKINMQGTLTYLWLSKKINLSLDGQLK